MPRLAQRLPPHALAPHKFAAGGEALGLLPGETVEVALADVAVVTLTMD
jgi:hypothetical protein